ncbi:hypothetical protein G3N56_18080 [Desulfovibrio sulfodismutans]|uniref:Uncharacterized protein n=1 Tax=Desulfolutivibrio sulfodismutans TaxID=63561 RepID=A0A7K3NR99_9BACT|nr:DUF6765 family protein [Desulfolutivibrio sulfodismutans]NDY58647.1 hypothetical protein [Desulfolutivibrio sulfodismutans]QLA12437.1 hypothetical protein GD606_09190 [Desulfolutivibrio sulfodismutans DSM 3696]
MEIDFHHHATYLIAVLAGIAPHEAAVLAHACQLTDDNTRTCRIDHGLASTFVTTISQAADPLRCPGVSQRIFCLFHFPPGNPEAARNLRRDGQTHPLVCTPGGEAADRLLDTALASGDLYRLGLACHTFADAFAHQNFVGGTTAFNGLRPGPHGPIPRLGHEDAGAAPDDPLACWTDPRLREPVVRCAGRFLDAARGLYRRLSRHSLLSPARQEETPEACLARDLTRALGLEDPGRPDMAERMRRLEALALTPRYGWHPMPDYSPTAWFDAAVAVTGPYSPADGISAPFWNCRWRSPETRTESHWYRFQKAVSGHAVDMLAHLGPRLAGVSLPDW